MRTLRLRDNSEEATFELNLAPMMDMLVSIIPFMLLSAAFIQIVLIDSPLPTPVAQALQQDRQNDKREVSIQVGMDNKAGYLLDVKDEAGRVTKFTVPKTGAEFDYTGLHKKLVEVKQAHPKVFRIELNPADGVEYKNIVHTMDASRDMHGTDPKIMIENAATPLLFPDVVLSNVMN
jgi:biopolymer transport protein ExbD